MEITTSQSPSLKNSVSIPKAEVRYISPIKLKSLAKYRNPLRHGTEAIYSNQSEHLMSKVERTGFEGKKRIRKCL